ncbi:hypothetical protein AX16_005488 [Volvariella volvacea WC 439]|nr:hypothetical protein AX16_005488 [Volvariella volvacea WC 439]
MAHKQPCAKYQYVVTPAGPKILPVEEPSCKDEESPADYNAGGYLPVKVGDTFRHGRYRVVRKLGWGHFSTVWLVKDERRNAHSALKIVKSAGRYAETARDEIKLLSHVASFSPTHPGRAHIVSFLDSFSHQSPESAHVCIVFEPLGENLLALIERHKKKGVPTALVKWISHQVLLGLQYLHDECDLVHTDIKPENILISIPDIEYHILQELAQSAQPTSRRVGVPLPTKTRAGVSIPPNQLRARRQVQIFDSQPLSSPCRSAGFSAHARARSGGLSAHPTGSGSNSAHGSYIGQMQMSRLAAEASGSVSPLVSSPNPSTTGLRKHVGMPAMTSHCCEASAQSSKPGPAPALVQSNANIHNNSPSTSSSSSSISSTLASTAVGSSSIISTPPSSLSHSIGNTVTGFMMLSGPTKPELGDKASTSELRIVDNPPTLVKQPTAEIGAISTSWRDNLSLTGSWTKVSASLSSSFKSISSLASTQTRPPPAIALKHSRSQSGNLSGFWKDPGAAAPAPAVLVSTIATSDGPSNEGVYIAYPQGSAINSQSETSSNTVTVTRPSPAGTPSLQVEGKATSLLNGVSQKIQDVVLPDTDPIHQTGNPSLLTLTAPVRNPPSQTSPLRKSPLRNLIAQASPSHTPASTSSSFATQDTSRPAMNVNTTVTNQPISLPNANYSLQLNDAPDSIPSTSLTPSSTAPPAPPPTPVTPPNTTSLLDDVTASANPTSTCCSACQRNVDESPSEPLQEQYEDPPPLPYPPISVKIADLGNATPSKKHFTEDIQTRQYRAPEAILGRKDWDATADIWSVACVVFELLTAEYLFDPQGQGELFTKDDDHMAQIIELLGDFPLEVKMGGKYSRELFDHTGALRYIKTLKPWPLLRVMIEKYLYTEADANSLCSFLEPMLKTDFKQRANARDLIDHSWLSVTPEEEGEIGDEW